MKDFQACTTSLKSNKKSPFYYMAIGMTNNSCDYVSNSPLCLQYVFLVFLSLHQLHWLEGCLSLSLQRLVTDDATSHLSKMTSTTTVAVNQCCFLVFCHADLHWNPQLRFLLETRRSHQLASLVFLLDYVLIFHRIQNRFVFSVISASTLCTSKIIMRPIFKKWN